jgi:DNA-binding HxlR family transcriptional regulator
VEAMQRFDTVYVEQATRTMEVLKGKWTVQILCVMFGRPVRLSQLRRMIPTASKKALTANLRSLEKAQIIFRRDLSDSLLHVEYELVGLARAPLITLVGQLAEFQSVSSPAVNGNEYREGDAGR